MEELLFNISLEVVKCIQKERYDVLEKRRCLQKISKEYIKNVWGVGYRFDHDLK